jgi:ribonuclease P protein component
MLPKKNRASTKEIERIFQEGKFVISPSFTFKYIRNNEKGIKISFIAPKSVARLAVTRNLLRRRGYVALEKYIELFPFPVLGAFVFKKHQDNISILENEIKNIFNKIN